MNQVPHITIEQAKIMFPSPLVEPSLIRANELIDKHNSALAEQEQPLITADEARKLGAGKAEYQYQGSMWDLCEYLHVYNDFVKYRAIKQPEPVELKICTIKNLDTGIISTMQREAAKKLQAELGDAVEWSWCNATLGTSDIDDKFDHGDGIYTYKLKANLVKLDGELMTKEAAIAKWESKKNECDLTYTNIDRIETIWLCLTLMGFSEVQEYQLRAKPVQPTVKLTIDDEPAKMLTPDQCEAERLARVDTHDVQSRKNEGVFEPVIAPVWWWSLKAENGHEYHLIRKQPKQVSWTGSRADVIALLHALNVHIRENAV